MANVQIELYNNNWFCALGRILSLNQSAELIMPKIKSTLVEMFVFHRDRDAANAPQHALQLDPSVYTDNQINRRQHSQVRQ